MFKLLNEFLTKRLLPSFLCQTILDLRSNSFSKFRPPQKLVLNFFSILLIFLLCITQLSCNTTEPPIILPPPIVKDTIIVSVESFTHRSVTLNVTSTANSKNSSVRLIRELNGITTTVAEYPILVKDTTLIDDNNGIGLLLDTTYTYYAVRVDSLGQQKDTSNTVTQKTLAPTSHNYTWQEFTIGDWQSSLYDVWGTDENNVYACGGVTINDTVYGILHWNGVEWKPFSSTAGGYAIYGFSDNDIWVVGGGVFHFNGVVWEEYTYRDPVINNNITYTSVWGTSSNNLYLGNGGGKIIHWDGSKATVMATNNSIHISDIYGVSNNFILAVGSTGVSPSAGIMYNGTSWQPIPGLVVTNHKYKTVYVINNREYVVGGSRTYHFYNNTWHTVIGDTLGEIQDLKGDKETGEMIAVGDVTTIVHYNGVDWKNISISGSNFKPYGVYIKNNKVFIVGSEYPIAKILIGTKN